MCRVLTDLTGVDRASDSPKSPLRPGREWLRARGVDERSVDEDGAFWPLIHKLFWSWCDLSCHKQSGGELTVPDHSVCVLRLAGEVASGTAIPLYVLYFADCLDKLWLDVRDHTRLQRSAGPPERLATTLAATDPLHHAPLPLSRRLTQGTSFMNINKSVNRCTRDRHRGLTAAAKVRIATKGLPGPRSGWQTRF